MTQPLGKLGGVWERVAVRESARIRDAFLRDAAVPPGTRSLFAYALALAVVLLAIAMLVGGIWLSLRSLGLLGPVNIVVRFVTGMGGLILLGLVWLSLPRFPAAPGLSLDPQKTPELHALVAEVAQALGVTMPRQINLISEVNAFMGRSGFPPQPTLAYGLPLWYALHPQERVAIIAHELAHERNGDPTRGGLIGFAVNLLAQLENAICPRELWDGNLMTSFGNLLGWVASWVPLGLYTLLIQLAGAEQQRAEYRADLLAAGVAGTDAAASALDKLHFASALESALHTQRHRPQRPHAFLELRHIWDTMPEETRQKRRAEYTSARIRLDDSHPPTVDRIRVVQAHPYTPRVELTEERAARIDAELQPYVAPLEEEAYTNYRAAYDW